MIDHPQHYQTESGMEVIDVIEQFNLNFHLGNAIKYILRAGKKEDYQEDLSKAIWYLKREIERSFPEIPANSDDEKMRNFFSYPLINNPIITK